MASLNAAAVCILCTAQPIYAPQIAQWRPIIEEASARFAIPEDWIARAIAAESGGRTAFNGKPITSNAGAMGLMQVMPGTFADMQRRYGVGSDPYDPRTNILAGTAYLRVLYDRFGYPDLFAAYNAGPSRFEEFLFHGRPLPRATIAYVNRIAPGGFAAPSVAIPQQNEPRPSALNPSASPLFFVTGSRHQSATPIVTVRPGGVPVGSSSAHIRSLRTELLFSSQRDLFMPLSTLAR